MGTIRVNGRAEKKYEADTMTVTVSLISKAETARKAVDKGRADTETFLKALEKSGADLSRVRVENSETSSETNYNTKQNEYKYKTSLSIELAAKMGAVDVVADIISANDLSAEYSVGFSLSDKAEREKEVLKEAVLNSRQKAEIIAEAADKKLAGIESANYECSYEPFCIEERERGFFGAKPLCMSDEPSMMSELRPTEITISKEIDVVWNIE